MDAMDTIENRPFDEIKVGDSASLTHTLTREDAEAAPGMWGGTLIATVIDTMLPGPGTIYLGQTLRFTKPVGPGEAITTSVTVTQRDPATHRVTLACRCANQTGEALIEGTAEVMAPTEKVRRLRAIPPAVHRHADGARYRQLIEATKGLTPIRTAVVHPVDRNALLGAVDAARAGLIVPILVGPEAKIRAVAAAESVDLSPYALVATRHSHEAAERAVAMARAGEAEALMKGSLHTDELMAEVVAKETGLRTARRISHVFVVDLPTYARPLFITDAAINIAPDLDAKRDIVQNAIDLARVLGVERPRVAILSAIETLNAKIQSTLDAAALCKMAERGQITGGVLDGPLAFDNAVSEEAARLKGIESPVAGHADILVVPDLESGNMLAKQLEYLTEAQCAGIVLGARVPIVLTSRADSALTRMASCAVALLYARRGPRL
jgi:phosphate acetyltransferase/phosphate butyryltransferase